MEDKSMNPKSRMEAQNGDEARVWSIKIEEGKLNKRGNFIVLFF